MSGGQFNYKQYEIDCIADQVKHEIRRMMNPHREQFYYDFDDETIRLFTDAVKALRIAAIYAQRIDWLMSGDDGDESFKERLKQELKEEEEVHHV